MNTIVKTLPSAEEAALAKISSQELSAFLETKAVTQQVTLTSKDGTVHQVDIPVSALRLLIDVLTLLGEGNTVNLIPVHAELTTQEGADLLNISRPTFVKLLDEGAVPYHRTGNRRKVNYTDVMAYKAEIDRKRLQSLDELSRLDQDLGMGY